ncbi:carbonic anhydrase [Legionella drancourtii]|uniref:Carbonic anhydrase n=1 Tax=Legionella drancourtii LLAP12 TaxID=658187 RepID=G9ES02_9GAMM|nr:carbonic anhydrase [Legionella drancourtii]EHL29783.1 hypothetical protein LDG_8074 [Legionella drancourtii LLAP12]
MYATLIGLLKGIQHFKAHAYEEKKKLFSLLVNGQKPSTLFITCSDSRIIPALITNSDPGNLFVGRNVGNVIPLPSSESSSIAAVIEYAVKVLDVQEIVVCGHTHCGAMNSLHTPHLEEILPTVAGWLAETKSQLHEHTDSEIHSLTKASEENILNQIKNLHAYPAIIEKLEQSQLSIHGWLYEFETGQIRAYESSSKQFVAIDEVKPNVSHDKTPLTCKLVEGVRHFKAHEYLQKKELFTSLTGGQSPKALVIACADSRITPTLITNTEPGEIFVVRNVGNIVPPHSSIPSGEAAAIEYALKVLQIKNIIVCGHSHCGAMQGLLTPDLEKDLPAVASWLIYAKPTLERLKEKHHESSEHPLVCATKENTLVQINNLKTHPIVIEKLTNNELQIYAWFYDFEAGEVLIYDQEIGDFISFDDTVTKVFLSEEVLAKMNAIVEEEAMSYLTSLASPTTEEAYKLVMPILNTIKLTGISVIWEYIKTPVTIRLDAEFGGLCPHPNDKRFTSLVEKSLEVKLAGVRLLQKQLMDSPAYRQVCSQTSPLFMTMPKAEPGEKVSNGLGL